MKKVFVLIIILTIALTAFSWYKNERNSVQIGGENVSFKVSPLSDKIKVLDKEYGKDEYVVRKKELIKKVKEKTNDFNDTQEWIEVANQEIKRCTGGAIQNVNGNLIDRVNKIIESC